jgi:beta-aspartyl-peptidase (threonine type)
MLSKKTQRQNANPVGIALHKLLTGLTGVCLLATTLATQAGDHAPIALALHGGAGTITRENMDAATEQAYRETLAEALDTGYAILREGGSALDAVEQTVQILERSPLFNAGVGAVLTWEGEHELDAAIMRGDTRAAGAVAGVKRIESPIAAARAVMEASPHVFLAGSGAEDFAAAQGLSLVDNNTFTTPRRQADLQRYKARQQVGAAQGNDPAWKMGTVGAVALDKHGVLAAATSTGGMTGKRWGRVGDAPIIGAGTYADENCAVSATGHGEYFIRYHVAADICARVRYRGDTLVEAGDAVIHGVLRPDAGEGGVIALDSAGRVAMPFNSQGMYRAAIDRDGQRVVQIYQDEQ